MDVAAWLRGLGLERYEAAFRDNEIDWAVLPRLTSDDLREIGVVAIGHRRRLLDAIAALEAVAPAAIATAGPPATSVRTDAERRQLTVMFCDLVGSTPLSARLDPEDLRGIIGAYHRCVSQIVEGFGGFVARYMGDGVLVYFGYPQAHEDDAERATRCGLALVDRVPQLDQAEELHARVGIATGLVVVGGEVAEHDVAGDTPNLAARLQTVAEPDSVVIAASTRRLTGDLFEHRDLGEIELKGIAAPVSAWQVLRPSAVASRFEALRGSALTRLIGRDEEIDLLLRRWARAKAGDGQVVLVSGESGIGKSRIVAALTERLRDEPHLHLRFFCSPYHQDSALFPFIDQLGHEAGFARDDSPAARQDKLEALLARAAPVDEDLALFADLMSLPASERQPLANLSLQRKKEKTLEALMRRLECLARRQLVFMVFEDAHWIDPTSRELLDLIVELVRSLPILLVVTLRPEFQPPWTGQPQVTMLALNRLDRRDRTAMIEQIAGSTPLPDEVIDQIADRTDGVPLFVEELTKSVLESGVSSSGIPATLHDSLMARLDRMASGRGVAQTGAAIGREFSYELLRAVSGIPEHELNAALARLVASELLFQRGTLPDATYTFKHALVQDAAHESLLRSSRQQLHAQIAEALETHAPELMDSQPELFAQHYTEAGLVEKSVAFWGNAGRRSAARSAMTEASAQFQKALDQLKLLPDTTERQGRELEIRSALGAVLSAAKGFAARETGCAYARARKLWEELDSPSEFLHIPYGQSRYHGHRNEFDLALQLDKDLLRLSSQRKDSTGLILGHLSTGRNLMLTGQFARSLRHLQNVLALYDPILHSCLIQQTGDAPNVNTRALSGIVLCCLGYPNQALAQSSSAVVESRKLGHPRSLALSLSNGAMVASLVGANTMLGGWVDELVAVATEQGFPYWSAQGTIYRGWVKVMNSQVAEGEALMRSGSIAYRATGAEAGLDSIALLATTCELGGRIGEAMTLLDEALQIVERTGERWSAAELNRRKGQLLLRQGYSKAAEALCREALSIAREQEAKLWELRAAASLARLWCEQGRRADARDLLAPVYGWFTEGFDTPDLKEAKRLLDELHP
jgi:class 3 adenylate cyclase/predicted ATPase